MTLWINDSGANTDEIRAGVHAAERTFENAGWRAGTVYRAMLAETDAGDDRGGVATTLWGDAEMAAFRAAFAGWASWPEGAALVLNDA